MFKKLSRMLAVVAAGVFPAPAAFCLSVSKEKNFWVNHFFCVNPDRGFMVNLNS